jgi:hypothetical protein
LLTRLHHTICDALCRLMLRQRLEFSIIDDFEIAQAIKSEFPAAGSANLPASSAHR